MTTKKAILLATNFDAAEQAQWLALLRAALPDELIVDGHAPRGPGNADGIDIALVANPALGALQGLTQLRLVQSLWAGVERLLADPTIPRDVPLARMVDPAMNTSMAETALWAVLGLQRGFFGYARQQHQGQWLQHPLQRADETPVAVLGLGQMGRAVARRLLQAGYPVQAWSRSAQEMPGAVTASGREALPGVLGAAQVVVNLLPLTPDTAGLFNRSIFGQMRRGSALVNLARGAHVVDADLLAALAEGHLSHAVLDVFREEPLPASHPFWKHPQVTVLPHVAAPTDPRTAVAAVVANLIAHRAGAPLTGLVDRARGY
jgi:glyoxylate/hydroxypyruvate reductase